MGFSKFVKRLKHSRPGISNTDESRTGAGDAPSAKTTVPLEKGNSSVSSSIPISSSSADQRASHPDSYLHESTGPLSPEVTPSLWTRAYEALRDKEMQLVDQYETFLSRELDEHAIGNIRVQVTPSQEDLNHTKNRIEPNHDKRQAQLKTITDRGLLRADEKRTNYTIFGHNFVLKDQVAHAAQFIQAIKGLIDEAVRVSPEASLAWAGVCVLLPVLTNPSAAEEASRCGLSYVTSRIRYYVELERLLWPEALRKPNLKTEFDKHIIDLYQHILEFQIRTVLRFYRKWLNLGRDMIRHDDWNGMLSKVKELEQVVREESSTANTIASRNTLEDISKVAEQQFGKMQSLISVAEEQLVEQRRTNQILEDRRIDLPIVNEARYDSADVQDGPRCESGTRICIRETITQWADEGSGEPLFWLVGPAGTGKSTIARTVADSFESEKRLVGGYFFKRGEQGRNDTSRLFPTLAMQLADESPLFRGCLRKSLDGLDRDSVEKRSLEFQFDKLLRHPLADLSPTDTSELPKLLIIDALDECERPEHLSRILALLSELCNIPSMRLRVLLTSRSAPKIIDAFESLLKSKTARSFELHLKFSEETKADIQVFLRKRFADIRMKCRVQQDPWPTVEDLDRLVQLATSPEPLFIYAATLCRFIYDERRPRNPKNQLKLWLEQCESNKSQLHQIYDPILNQIFPGNEEAELSQQLQFLGALVLLAIPLPAMSLAALLDIDPDDINWWLPELHAVLNIPSDPQSPIKLLHKSFSDFLLSPDDSSVSIYRVDAAGTHDLLAAKCIQRMASGLKQDICDIRKLDATRDDIDKNVIDLCISADLKYACLHWVYHLQCSGRSFDNSICTFFYEHFLHWLEVLSLLGRLSDAVTAIEGLLGLIQRFSSTPFEFVDFVKDASRVISSFGSVIERTPLQTYGALLFFSPVASRVRQKLWSQRMPRLGHIQGIKPDWDAHLQTLSGHSGFVKALTFSPDGQLLASASFDHEIQLWNATTGSHLQTLEGHSGPIDVVIFSPDSQFLASGSYDQTVRIWGVTNTHQQTLIGHSRNIEAISFSPDGKFLTSVSEDLTVLLWDVKTGVLLKRTYSDESSVLAVAFSSDSQLMALAFSDNTIQLRNLATGLHKATLKGHYKSIKAVTFSPDNRFVPSGSYDRTVRLWDVATGAQKYILKGHGSFVKAVAFSSDSQLLASAFHETIQLWNVTTGVHQNTFKDHSGDVSAVAFSPYNQILASGSMNSTVQLWDTRLYTHQQSFDRHCDHITKTVFSPDGQLVASASWDQTVQVWDASTGSRQSIFRGHTDWVGDVIFSPDNKFLASGCYNEDAVRIWNLENGTRQQTVNGLVQAVDYSTDGQLVAVGSSNTIELYNAMAGAYLYKMEGHNGPIDKIVFSPDGQILASWSRDTTIRLWNLKTGTVGHIFEEQSARVSLITFSPNSQLIAAVSDMDITWWNAETSAHHQTLDNYGYDASTVAFSPNTQLLVVAMQNLDELEKTNLFDATTGELLAPLQGRKGYAIDIAFSPDSKFVAVASRDRTIRIWNVTTYTCLHTLESPEDVITKIKFSPDGQMIASASRDKTIRLWNVTTGFQIQMMQYDKGFVREITFLPNELLVSVSNDELNWFWNLWNPMTLEFYSHRIADAHQRTSPYPVSCKVSLDADEVWITKGSEKLVWIPPEYRPTAWANRESTIFIGSSSGYVIRFQVD